MTSRGPAWSFSPNNLKKVADLELALGVNRFEIHESTHQPVADMAPGLTLGPYGLWFNRNQIWAEEAKPWVTYLARCSYLLQQGRYYGDVAYFYGEEGPLTAVFGWKPIKDAPEGYAFDFVNSDVVLHELSVKDGRLVTPGGTSYRILYLGGRSQRMTLPVMRKLLELVKQGAVLVGERPTDSPSLADNEREFEQVADELWGKKGARLTERWTIEGRAAPNGSGKNKVGRGFVFMGLTVNEVLAKLGTVRDWEYTKPQSDTTLMFLHRKLTDGDVYFVDNRMDCPEDVRATFRVDGKAPELWDAATGTTQPASYEIANGRTTIPLHLDPYGTIFVIFRTLAKATSRLVPKLNETVVSGIDDELNRDWKIQFESGRGAPATAAFDRLNSWSESTNDGVKYFSGTATYTKTIEIPADAFKAGAHQWLDLGDVKEVADVTVNGQDLGVLWKTPFKVDVTNVLVQGRNQIEVKVTNLWVNRMIGDQQPWSLKKYTFADFTPYKTDSPLLPSGLLGPVRLISETAQ